MLLHSKLLPGQLWVLGVNAASQQTLFIVSSSPSNPILGEVNQMLVFWEIFLRLDESHSCWKLDKGPEHPIQALNRLKALWNYNIVTKLVINSHFWNTLVIYSCSGLPDTLKKRINDSIWLGDQHLNQAHSLVWCVHRKLVRPWYK